MSMEMMGLRVGQVPQKCNVSNQGIAQIYIYIQCMPLAVKRLIKLLFHYLRKNLHVLGSKCQANNHYVAFILQVV